MCTISLNLHNIQGNSLGGFKKDYQANLFLTFRSAAAGRAWIRKISEDVAASSSAAVIKFNNQFSALRAQGIDNPEELISATWVNLVLSFRGLSALRVSPGDLAAFPQAFRDGMAKRQIGDLGASRPDNWISPFDRPDDVHALLIVAADYEEDLKLKVQEITDTPEFRAGAVVCLNQDGKTLPKPLRGHEHFGFKDGISQPGIRGVDLPDDPVGNPNQGHPGQDLLWPGEFIIGYATQIPAAKPGFDGPNPKPGPDSQSGPAWTVDGSYLVFRRLRQDVAGFEQSVASLAERLGWSTDLTGAKLIGRYKSGAPLEQREFQPGPYVPPDMDPGNSNQGGSCLRASSDVLNNNFEFGDDPDGAICPLAAHIRKAYPRDQFTVSGNPRATSEDSESQTQTHRLLRRGIPYAKPYDPSDRASAGVDRGLLFICYQKDIETHFEFVQGRWVNELAFPPRPAGAAALPGAPGQDPIISQSWSGSMLVDPKMDPISIDHFVTTTGGEYFFSPSIRALREIGDGSL
jgi:Dyp-type peroxidase family